MKIKLIAKRQYPALKSLYKEFEISDDAKICIAVGGDGTFIEAARSFDGPILPIRGEESGSTGYYSDIGLSKIDTIINKLKRNEYTIEELSKKIEIRYKDKTYFAVNEALLRNIVKEVFFKVYQVEKDKKKLLYPYLISGDGVLITGNVGSTAYNRNAHGPIILSEKVVCLNFLFTESLLSNPLVLNADSEICVEVVKGRGSLMQDGISIADMSAGESFYVKQSKEAVQIIRLNGMKEGFSDKLARMINSKLITGVTQK